MTNMKLLIILLLFTKLLKAVDDAKYYEAIAKISREVAKIYTKNPQTFPNVGISDTCECGCGKKLTFSDDLALVVFGKSGSISKVIRNPHNVARKVNTNGGPFTYIYPGMRETLHSSQVKALVQKMYKRSPSHTVIGIDWSGAACAIPGANGELVKLSQFTEICQANKNGTLLVPKIAKMIGAFTYNEMRDERFFGALLRLIARPLVAAGKAIGKAGKYAAKKTAKGAKIAAEIAKKGAKGTGKVVKPIVTNPTNILTTTLLATTLLNPGGSAGGAEFNAANDELEYEGGEEEEEVTDDESSDMRSVNKDELFSVIHTGDVMSAPEKDIGQVNIFANGGRLQPGCFKNNDSIEELGNALKCSDLMAWKFYENTIDTEYKIRSCQCWDIYRQGRCADRLSNFAGYRMRSEKINPQMPLRYFVRTAANASSLGDTSTMKGSSRDFAYKFDTTCASGISPPRDWEPGRANKFESSLWLLLSLLALI